MRVIHKSCPSHQTLENRNGSSMLWKNARKEQSALVYRRTALVRIMETRKTKLLVPCQSKLDRLLKKESVRASRCVLAWLLLSTYTPCSTHNAIHCNVYSIQLHKSELLTNTFCFIMFNFFSSSSAAFWKGLLGQSSICWDVREELHAQRHCHTCYLYKVSDISSLSY